VIAGAGTEAWGSGVAYEPYIGRWSRLIAREFVRWLGPRKGDRWLEVGCGTGALTHCLTEAVQPALVLATDRSGAYVGYARAHAAGGAARFVAADAMALPVPQAMADCVVSGLVLNLLPQPALGLTEMVRVVRTGGTVAAYVWDYAGGMELLRYFWDAAVELDPAAAALDEAKRFPLCTPEELERLWQEAGLVEVQVSPIEVPTQLRDFEDYWTPFLGGQGPAPGYVGSLHRERREALRELLRARLPVRSNGEIHLQARAWAVRGRRVL
jgi:SAM-dependent methyltransferase